MALRLKHGIFIHFPKTGGVWVTKLLMQLGLVVEPLIRPHCSRAEILAMNPALSGLKSFCFVRHPFGWYQSFFSFRLANGEDPLHPLHPCRAASFQEFIANVVERCPGFLSAHLKEMTDGVSYIGRFEALRESLISILASLGEEFSYEAVYNQPADNVSQGAPNVARWYTPDLLERLYQAESYAFKTFGYGMDR